MFKGITRISLDTEYISKTSFFQFFSENKMYLLFHFCNLGLTSERQTAMMVNTQTASQIPPQNGRRPCGNQYASACSIGLVAQKPPRQALCT
jgi:hypothetical protein